MMNVNFIATAAAAGGASGAYGAAFAIAKARANAWVSAGLAVFLDQPALDLSTAGFTKNGCTVLSLAASGGTATIDLTSLAAVGAAAGDTSFANWFALILTSIPMTIAQDVTVTPGATNPAHLPFSGTTPSFTLYGNSQTVWQSPAGQAVNSTHKTITLTNNGSNPAVVAVCCGGN